MKEVRKLYDFSFERKKQRRERKRKRYIKNRERKNRKSKKNFYTSYDIGLPQYYFY